MIAAPNDPTSARSDAPQAAPGLSLGRVDEIIDAHKAAPSSLLAIMQDIQDEVRYLPRPAMERVAARLTVPVSRVFHMATFFESFHLEPRGKHICTVCMGTACHVRGAQRLVEGLERDLGVPSGGTTADRAFTIEQVNCVGACALGPLVIIDGDYHGTMTGSRLESVIDKIRKADAKGDE